MAWRISPTVATILFFGVTGAGGATLTPQEESGRRLYREGIGSTGEPVVAGVGVMATQVRGNQVPCAGCHGRDGRGRAEGGVRPPNIAWRELVRENGHRHAPAPGGPERAHPPFDSRSFMRAVTEGLDPAGNRIDPAMPRYRLSSMDLENLEAYLKRIDDDHDPGISDRELRLGSLLPKTGPLAGPARSVERALRAVIDATNSAGGVHGRRIVLQVFDPGSDAAAGRAALAELDRVGVFALLAPMAPAIESELTAFCESRSISMVGIMPPVRPDPAPRHVWHMVAGAGERAAAIAEFAMVELEAGRRTVSVVIGPGGRALAQADRVDAQFSARGLPPPTRDAFSTGRSGQLVAAHQLRAVSVVIFLGEFRDFSDYAERAEEAGFRPQYLVPDAGFPELADELAARIHFASSLLPTDFGSEMLAALRADSPRPGVIEAAAWGAATVTAESLKRAGRALSAHSFRAAMQSLSGFSSGATPPVSFTGARRVGTGGAWVMPAHRKSRAGGARFITIDRTPP